MQPKHLLSVFPDHDVFLALQPEELGAVLMEVIPGIEGNQGKFVVEHFQNQLFPNPAVMSGGYPANLSSSVYNVLGEALAWLESIGVLMHEPGQPTPWMMLTRRGKAMKSRDDLESYRMARTLPIALLQPKLADKVFPLYLRGEYDTAVFQAFREVEVAVRNATKLPNELVGRPLMAKAFEKSAGPLTDQSLTEAEREAELFLFMGAIGHGRNPPGHRDVNHSRETAARLIVFASHLLDLVAQRVQALAS